MIEQAHCRLASLLLAIVTIIVLSMLSGCGSMKARPTDSATVLETQSGPAFLDEELPSGLTSLLSQARTEHQNENSERALQILQQAAQEFAEYPQPDVNRAIVYMQLEDYEQAMQATENALSKRELYAPAVNLQGVLHRINGDFEQAKQSYQNAIASEPNYANAFLNLGILADLYLQDFTLALSSFEAYLNLVKEDEKVKNWVVDLKQRIPEE